MDKNTNEGIGASLFKGEHSIFVQNDESQQEEEENLEHELRRQEELQNLIANAFDDIVYEDEHSTSFNSTNTSKYKSHVEDHTPVDEYIYTDKNYKNTSFNSLEQLQVLYQVRVKEAQRLSKELDDLKAESKSEKDAASRKALLLEGECKRVSILLEQAQALLVDKTEEINNKSREVSQLNELIDNLKSSKEKLEEDVIYWKTNSNDLEQRLHLVEKGFNKSVSEKQIRSHYEQEINNLQNALQIANSKLERNEHECHNLQLQIKETEHSKEIILAEKADIINSLTKSLEDSQAHCYSLLNKISILQQDNKSLQNEILSKDSTTMRNFTATQNHEEVITTLQDELKRSLTEQTQKRNEIFQLEEIIKDLRLNEKHLKQELRNKQTTEKEENDKLRQQINEMHQDIYNLKNTIEENKLLDDNKHLNNSRMSVNAYTEKKKNKEDYKKLKQELDKIEQHINESVTLKDRYIKCEEQCLNLQETVAELNSKLSENQMTINNLREKLSLKEERDELIEILTTKAAMFEDYMANKATSLPLQDKAVGTEDNPLIKSEKYSQTDNSEHFLQMMNNTNQLEQMISTKNLQLKVLFDENKSLKEKIMFDRNAFTELTNVWTLETRKLNATIHVSVERNEELMKKVNELLSENKHKQIKCDHLNAKLAHSKEYINLIEIASTRHEKLLLSEYEQIRSKFEKMLSVIQKRVNQCIDTTNAQII